MTTEPIRTDSRTHYEARNDVAYGIRYNDMNGRLYRRLDAALGFIGMFGGAGAFMAAFAGNKEWGLFIGAVLAAAATWERFLGAVEKAVHHEQAKAAYADLHVAMDGLPLEEVEQRLRRLQGEYRSGIRTLEMPAYNATMRAAGRPDFAQQITRWERFIGFLA